jgi:Ca2+-transporting ATPase
MASVTFGWYAYRTLDGANEALVRSETFTLLAICQWFNVLNIRSATKSAFDLKVLKNKWLVGGILVGNALQALVIFWSPLGDLFHTVPIETHQIIVLGAVGSLVLWGEEFRKAIVRQLNKKGEPLFQIRRSRT